jgi:hypothetical protein
MAITAVSLFPAGAQGCTNSALRLGPSAGLPDCRAYEQVSSAAKNGVDAYSPDLPFPVEAPVTETSEGGVSNFAYQSLDPAAGPTSNFTANAYVATRGAQEWQVTNWTPPSSGSIPTSAAGAFLSYDFSPDLSTMVVALPWQSLVRGTPSFLLNLFLRDPTGNYSLLTTASPKVPVPEGCLFCFTEQDVPVFAGASSSYAHVIFEANESLVSSAPGGGIASLYESVEQSAGLPREVRLVGILPDGSVPLEGSMPGAGLDDNSTLHYNSGVERQDSSDVNHAISSDGSRVIFSAKADGGLPDPAQVGATQIYDRLGGLETIEISAPAKGATPVNPAAESAQFWGASADGSLVYFTSSAELTTPSNTGTANASDDLYRYDVDTETLTDLTVDPVDAATGAGVQGVVGVAGDGSYVYFVATGKLTPNSVDGQPNLYVSHEGGAPQLIATLNAADSLDWTSTPVLSDAYLTPDGRHLAFMSIDSLTGYDNMDMNTNQPDSEAYEYSAEDGTLACASCAGDGARPVGSAFIGTTSALGINGDGAFGTAFYHQRVLSDDGGRLFFWSTNPLLRGEFAGHMKVYEFERDGIGSCAKATGCIYSISGPAFTADDLFLDSSPSGDDVFFATYDQLTSADRDNLMDVYDARVKGGFPEVAPASTPCSSCQQAGSQPPQSISQAPSSEALRGNGNVIPPNEPKRKPSQRKSSHVCVKQKHGHSTVRNRCTVKPRRKHGHGKKHGASK